MRNWPLFQPPKKPMVNIRLDAPHITEEDVRNEPGWVKVTWTRPYFEIPPEPSRVPFRRSMLCAAVTGVILNRPLLIRPYYRETSIDLNDYRPSPKSLARFFEMWARFIRDTDSY